MESQWRPSRERVVQSRMAEFMRIANGGACRDWYSLYRWSVESPVGSYPAGASPYGVMDMAGNIWEWNHDQYSSDYYSGMPARNPSGPAPREAEDRARENRGGGSWTDRSGHLTAEGGHNLRSAARTGDEQNSSDDHLGFRVVIDFVDRNP